MTQTQGWILIFFVLVFFMRLGILLEHIRDRLDKIAANTGPRDGF